jgi:hypothetical protein
MIEHTFVQHLDTITICLFFNHSYIMEATCDKSNFITVEADEM